MICKYMVRKDSKEKTFLLKYTSSFNNLLSLEFFYYLLEYKRIADMHTSQNTDKHGRGERGEGRIFQHHKIRVLKFI